MRQRGQGNEASRRVEGEYQAEGKHNDSGRQYMVFQLKFPE